MRERSPGAWVDPACPVEWAHPLNRGLASCWMVPPNAGWRGGVTLRDLVRSGRKPNDGTLTNGPAWSGPKGRPGGHGCLTLDGSNDYVDFSAPAALNFVSSMAIMLYMRAPSDGFVLNKYDFSSSRGPAIITGSWPFSSRSVGLLVSVDGSTSAQRDTVTPGTYIPATDWFHWTGVFDATAQTLDVYVNGISQNGTLTGSVPASQVGAGTSWKLGARADGTTGLVSGDYDDIRLYSRAPSAAEVYAIYRQSRRGHPDTLRWLSARAWFVPQTGGGSFSGDATLLLESQACAASAAHAPPAFIASAPLALEVQTFVASASHATPVFTASAPLNLQSHTLASSAANTPPAFSGSAALGLQTQTLMTSGSHTPPAFAATAALDLQTQTFASSASLITGDFVATALLTLQVQTLAASGAHSTPSFAATAALDLQEQTLSAAGSLTTGDFVALAPLTLQAQTFSASGSAAVPQFTATAALDLRAQTLVSVALHPNDTTATADLVLGEMTFVGAAAGTDPGGHPVGPLPPHPEQFGVGPPLEWEGVDVTMVEWGEDCCTGFDVTMIEWESECCVEAGQMIQFPYPVRQYNRIPLRYTFRNIEGTKIDLTPFHHVRLHVKLNGQPYASTLSNFYGTRAGGKVQSGTLSFDLLGKWDAQFVLYDIDNVAVFSGDPIQFDVVVNVRNLEVNTNLSA